MEHKEFLEQKLKNLGRKFEKNRELGKHLLLQKKIVDKKLEESVSEASLILAKVAAIKEMINE